MNHDVGCDCNECALTRLVDKQRAQIEKFGFDNASLKMELVGLEHIRINDNGYLISREEAATKRAERAEALQIDLGHRLKKSMQQTENARAKARALKTELDDIKESYARIMSEKCPPDEMHCTCVPILRAKLADMETRLHGCMEKKTSWIVA